MVIEVGVSFPSLDCPDRGLSSGCGMTPPIRCEASLVYDCYLSGSSDDGFPNQGLVFAVVHRWVNLRLGGRFHGYFLVGFGFRFRF